MCHHTDYTIEFGDPEAYEDSNVVRLRLRAHCKRCKEPVRFIGVDEGFSLTRPCTSSDGFTIMIPAVMGLDDVEHSQKLAS